MISRKTEGLIAAPFTPMRADRTLALDAVEGYARRLHAGGVVGAFICGTTGEGMSLTTDERQALAERWVAAAPAGLRVIVHVGHNSLPDCRALAAHAEAIGADSIACMVPFFFKPVGVEGLVAWYEQVAAAAPNLPFYYYHIPSMTGVSVRVSEFLKAAAGRIPTLAGVKFTFEDLDDYRQCLELDDGRFDVLFGRDELLLSALALGARGAVGSTYNFAAPLYQALIEACRRGDRQEAAELQTLAVRMIDTLVAGGANFPEKRPWQGRSKVWYDTVFVLEGPDGEWKAAGRLPRPLGYGVSLSTKDGVVCLGGSGTAPVSLVQTGDWKLMEFLEDGRLELYNLRADIGESRNLAKEMPDKTKELHARLVAWRNEVNVPMPTKNDGSTPAPKQKVKGKKNKSKSDRG